MCGLNVLYNAKGGISEHAPLVAQMNAEMVYRGPDEQTVWSDGAQVIFGHCRLSIIGVENGEQPLFNSNKSLALVCNGEIYNYVELKEELEGKGYRFTTGSDCEVILYLYQEYGLDLFSYLRGMFAFCLWDASKKQLIAARDRFGKKPLYYARSADGIIFSSEIKAITEHFLNSPQINLQSIRHTLLYSHPISDTETWINEVKKIRPAEYLVVRDDAVTHQQYWDPNKIKIVPTNFERAKQETLRLLTESVDIRLRSEVPVAVLLSSGIDSTAVAALAKQCRSEVHAITVGYKGNHASDERELAKKFAAEKGLTWHQVELDEKDYQEYFEEYTRVIDEPVCDVAAIAQWGIYKKAKDLGFKVLLSGIGGDELFFGYGSHNQYAELWQKTLNTREYFPYKSVKTLPAFIRYMLKNRQALHRFTRMSPGQHLSRSFLQGHTALGYDWPGGTTDDDTAYFAELFRHHDTAIEKLYRFFNTAWLTNNCYHQADKLGLGNSVEVRAPFADHMLFEFVHSLPLELRYNKHDPKWLLKQALQGILPGYILNNPKKGFTPPAGFIHELVAGYDAKFFGLPLHNYNQVLADKMLSDHLLKPKKSWAVNGLPGRAAEA